MFKDWTIGVQSDPDQPIDLMQFVNSIDRNAANDNEEG